MIENRYVNKMHFSSQATSSILSLLPKAFVDTLYIRNRCKRYVNENADYQASSHMFDFKKNSITQNADSTSKFSRIVPFF